MQLYQTDSLDQILMEHFESVALNESVREWMVIIKSGNYDNKRVVYSTDQKSKAQEMFLDYRDKYPDYQFKLISKTEFRNFYHRFPEYMNAEVKNQLFGNKDDVKINKDFKRVSYKYDPEDIEVRVMPKIEKEIQKVVPKPKKKPAEVV